MTTAKDVVAAVPVVELKLTDFPVQEVVVYNDRAEVRRTISPPALKAGKTELLIKSLSHLVDTDSIRVEGTGEAVILDVALRSAFVEQSKIDKSKIEQEHAAVMADLHQKINLSNAELKRLESERHLIESYADVITKPDGVDPASVLKTENVGQLPAFLSFYREQMKQSDENIRQVKKTLEALNESLKVENQNMAAKHPSQANPNLTKDLVVLLETTQNDISVNISLSYVVKKASWTARYDLRVSSNEGIMKVTYFGEIIQTTGEDWNDVRLGLSTAQPSVGGEAPTLSSWLVSTVYNRGSSSLSRSKSISLSSGYAKPSKKESNNATAHQSMISTLFEIAHIATIPSDLTTHKVTIAVLELTPAFEYYAAPKTVSHAFLKAKVKNTSNYAFLVGPANVFLENNFVAKTVLPAVSPQEVFECSLGADNAVRIDYKPVKKFKEVQGILQKSDVHHYDQVIEVRNGKSTEIKIVIHEPIPQSNDDKIKVVVHEPDFKQSSNKQRDDLSLSDDGVLEWILKIKPGQTQNVQTKFSISFPQSEREVVGL